MVIGVLLLGIAILCLAYLINVLYTYIVALLFYHSLSEEDAKYLYNRAVGKEFERDDL